MGKAEDVGYNHRSTPFKQAALDRALGHLLGSSAAVARNHHRPCIVCDMTAGPGFDSVGQAGSPLIFARHLDHLVELDYHPTLVCVEQDADRLDRLNAVLAEQHPQLPVEYFTDQAEALKYVPMQAVGLTYWDPTLYNNLDKGLLTRFGNSHHFMDVLITRQCLATKRMLGAQLPDTLAIEEYLALTNKRRFALLMYARYNWWTFGFASNWVERKIEKMPEFCYIDDPRAKAWRRLWDASVDVDQDVDQDDDLSTRQGELPWGA